MKILISAAEASSDAHGAAVLKAFKQRREVDAFGIGGPKLKEAGLEIVVDARDLLAMGFTEIIGRLPRIFQALKQITNAAEIEKPDLAVVIDYPDFHFLLAKRLARLGVPVVYLIPPKVWVWRKRRLHYLQKYFRKLLCIFPFEEAFYNKAGVPATYVGNPLIDELPLNRSKEEARRALGISSDEKVLALLPGSRPSEFKVHIQLFIDAAVEVAKSVGKLKVLMPFPVTATMPKDLSERKAVAENRAPIDLIFSQGDAHTCMLAADAGIIKSGTSTLEAALLGCPHVVVYKPSNFAAWVWKYFIRYRGPVGLVNLVGLKKEGWQQGDDYILPEILCDAVSVSAISRECIALFLNYKKLGKMIIDLQQVKQIVVSTAGGSPSEKIVDELIEIVKASQHA